jgi:hypothetical protein
MKLSHNEHTDRFLRQIGQFNTQINQVTANKNGRSRAVRFTVVFVFT